MPQPVPPDRGLTGRRALALLLTLALSCPAARAHAQTAAASADSTAPASPFPVVPIATETPGRYTWSYVAMGSGVALVAASFVLARRANDTYADYLQETDPNRIESLFDRTVWLDRSSSGSLLLGEALVCVGLYTRFLRKPPGPVAWRVEPARCAVSLRF